jgi:hypothetical protein
MAGARDDEEAVNSFSQRKEELDARMPKGTEPWVLHDLRRTARKLMTRAGLVTLKFRLRAACVLSREFVLWLTL